MRTCSEAAKNITHGVRPANTPQQKAAYSQVNASYGLEFDTNPEEDESLFSRVGYNMLSAAASAAFMELSHTFRRVKIGSNTRQHNHQAKIKNDLNEVKRLEEEIEHIKLLEKKKELLEKKRELLKGKK